MSVDLVKIPFAVLAGEKWFVRMRSAITLREVIVTDVTAKTVEIKGLGMHDRKERYEHGEVGFIERMPLPKPPSDV
jgi:hypothetical protein